MIAEAVCTTVPDRDSAVAAERTVLEERVRLRKLLRTGMGQVHAVVMGAQHPIRSMVATVFSEFSKHLAQADALMPPTREENPPFGRASPGRLQREFADEIAMLEALSAWPEDNDELELALRFETLVPVLLAAIASEERCLLEPVRNDLTIDDPFGC